MSLIRHYPIAPTQTEARIAGEVIERHRHDNHQLIYLSSGVLAMRTERGAWVGSHDRAVWVPAGIWHEHRFYGASSFHTIGFGVDDAPLGSTSPTVVAVEGLLRELFIAYTDAELPAAEAGRIRGVLRDRLRRAVVQPLTLPTAADPRLADACRLVEDDLSRPQTLASLAHRVNVGERTLTRLYRSEFGTTYPQWRTSIRIFHAMVLLAEGASVTETAHACGWATTSAFVDTFGRTMGQTPGAYRSAEPHPAERHRV
jgi:AraC-like DNA-binding protein